MSLLSKIKHNTDKDNNTEFFVKAESQESDIVSEHFSHKRAKLESQIILATDSIPDQLLKLINKLNSELKNFQTPKKVEFVYNSTEYARYTFEQYVRKYCSTKKSIMFFGMNPGPWGMSQTGVPFGEISSVREWLKIEGPVQKPPRECPARPVLGFECKRSEISGKRFWGLMKELCKVPEKLFETTFIYNYLPEQWMTSTGCNMTPSDFKSPEMQPLYEICDPIFCEILKLYEVQIVVAIGKFCETRATKAITRFLPSANIKVVYLPHPSPRTVNNNNWQEKAIEHLRALDLLQYYTNDPIKTENC